MKIFRNIGANANSVRNSGEGYNNAFTLAEMMIVLLIASIILACMAPIMTTKMKTDSTLNSAPWRWSDNGSDAYYSTSDGQVAMIGQKERQNNDDAKFIIRSDKEDLISFKSANTNTQTGRLRMTANRLLLGSLANNVQQNANSVAVGRTLTPSGASTVALGNTVITSGENGVGVGKSSTASGKNSVAVGNTATASGENSVAVGNTNTANKVNSVALGAFNNATGENSVAVGKSINASSKNAVAVGISSRINPAANGSVAVGVSVTTAGENAIAVGNTIGSTGGDSVAIGYKVDSLGKRSVAIGGEAGTAVENDISIGNKVGSKAEEAPARTLNIAIGSNILTKSTGGDNIALGTGSLGNNTAGGTNIAMGNYALGANTTGAGNIALGSSALNKTTTANRNIAIGPLTLYRSASGEDNIAIGYYALSGTDTSPRNTANIAIGSFAMQSVSTINNNYPDNNVAIGPYSASALTTGSHNTALGSSTLQGITTQQDNTVVGYRAGQGINNGINANTPIYEVAGIHLIDISGNQNTAVGANSMLQKRSVARNTAVGYGALMGGFGDISSLGPSSYNTAIGYNACAYVAGSNKTCIGANSGPANGSELAKSTNTADVLFLGKKDTTVYIPGNLVVAGNVILNANDPTVNGPATTLLRPLVNGYSNGLMAPVRANDDNGTAQFHWFTDKNIGLRQNFTAEQLMWFDKYRGNPNDLLSDRRLKNVGKENTDGLAKLRQLKIYNYTFKKDKDKTPQVGVIAQDLQKVFPNAVKKAADGFLRIRLEDMFYAVINAIKELDTRVTRLEKENQMLKQQNKALELRLQALEKKVK